MSPKEKAEELYLKYKDALNIQNDMRPGKNPFAKQCAIICIEQIIGVLEEVNSDLGGTTPAVHDGKKWIPAMSYYESVLEHLNSMI